MADQYEIRDCHKCIGTKVFSCWSHIEGGRCFSCGGSGKVRVNLSAQKRRETAAKKAAEKARKNLADWIAANPSEAAIDDNTAGFIGEIRYKIMKYGQISEAQHNALKKALAQFNERKAKEEARKEFLAQSAHQGIVGEKWTAKVKVAFTKDIHTHYGVTTLYGLEDEKGNQFRWFSSSRTTILDKGEVVEIVGTVKKHDEYQGVKQTVLTRCKVAKAAQEAQVAA
jgi:hypothetical protein